MPATALYVETFIRADPDRVWRHTRDPAAHQRWDLRFTQISALTPDMPPAASPDMSPAMPSAPASRPDTATERFRYATRVLPGLTIAGHGTTIGERRRPDGTATSALRFASDHPLSPIRAGHGYWRYLPTGDGIRFLTGYDYRPGFGGRALDRAVRPLMGWATAWSFDRLRLWLETGTPPERLLLRALADTTARLTAVAATAAATRSVPLTAAAALACAALPPRPGTPSARRCRRTPADRGAATAPATLARLETP